MSFRFKIVLLVILLIGSLVTIITVTRTQWFSTQSQAAEIKGGDTYTNVMWPSNGNYSTREWDFTPLSDSYDGYYWSYQQSFKNGDGFYAGMQTGEGGRKKLFIYSVWNAIGASADGATPGAWCQTFGGEGEGYSCRYYHNWIIGRTYHFKIERVSPGWWSVSITDTVTGTKYTLGKIQVPSTWGGLNGGWSVVWTEMFTSEPYQTCNDRAYAKGIFSNFISDGSIKPQSYSPTIREGLCQTNGKVTISGGTLTQEMGLSALGGGLTGTYYNNIDFTGTSATRVDPFIKLTSWDDTLLPQGIDPETFSVRWEGNLIVPTSGSYTFYTETNDGARLWVNNQQLINGWSFQSGERSGTITLTGGQSYPIKMEYYDNTGTQRAWLKWSGPGINKRSIPQFYLRPNNVPIPSAQPTATPTVTPTKIPSVSPTKLPSVTPSVTLTQTPSPSPSVSVTPTMVPGGASFKIRTLLHGLGNAGDNTNPESHTFSNKNPKRKVRSFTLEVSGFESNYVSTLTGNLTYSESTGTYDAILNSNTPIPAGSYYLKLSVPGFLNKRSIPFTITPNTINSPPVFSLINGDVTKDNVLSILDYNRIVVCYSYPGFRPPCTGEEITQIDLDDNGTVDEYDINLFRRELSVQAGD